ncbi:MAG: hypothetical protein ACM3NQ_01920, partial [Bacteroidales bacterium]
MTHRRVMTAALVLCLLGLVVPLSGQQIPKLTDQVIEKVLPNGLKVLMVKRPEAPLIRCILA